MTPFLWVAAGGLAGTLARYVIAERLGEWFDSGTLAIFVVNVAGSFAIGLFLGLGDERFAWSEEARLLVATGFLGAFTTFSTLTWQTWRLYDNGDLALALLNIGGSVLAGMAAVFAGVQASRAM